MSEPKILILLFVYYLFIYRYEDGQAELYCFEDFVPQGQKSYDVVSTGAFVVGGYNFGGPAYQQFVDPLLAEAHAASGHGRLSLEWDWSVAERDLLLNPLKKATIKTLFPIINIGYMGNNIFPARLGEVLRAVVLKRKEDHKELARTLNRLADLEEDVLRKILGLLVEKGVATRDEILDRVWGNAALDSSSNVVDAVVKREARR